MPGPRSLAVAFLSLACFAEPIAAQKGRIVVGPMAGVTFSTLSGDDISGSPFLGSRTGFTAGGFISFNANTHVAVEPQLLYVQKGARYDDGYFESELALDYIEVPVLIKGRYWFGPEKRPVTLNGFGGPAIAFNVHCATTSSEYDVPCTGSLTKTAELSVLFGAGVEYLGFSLQGRYDLSMTNAFSSTSSGEPNAKNRSWMVTLGYMVPIK